jgi:hypothetical protein
MVDTATTVPGMIIRTGDNEPYYAGMVAAALVEIASKPVGASLLRSIGKRADRAKFGYTVCIQKPSRGRQSHVDEITHQTINDWGNKAVRVNEIDACNGTGTQTVVWWNPNILTSPDGARPPFVALAHELIHALNNLRGTAYADTRKEEYCTVGLDPYATRRKRNENAIRAEHGIAARTQYAGL